MTNALHKIRHYYAALGVAGVVVFLWSKITGSQPVFRMRIAGIKHPVYVRVGTTDASVLRQVLLERHYDAPLPHRPTTIIDAGANIGLAAVYFANKYPDATIIAIEPEASNYRMLQMNVAPYPRVRTIQAALWSERCSLDLVDPGSGSHGFRTEAHNDPATRSESVVQALTVEDIMTQMELETISLLKVDIEGSEREVFRHSARWIPKVDAIMVELHDHLQPDCSVAFEAATSNFSQRDSRGETVIRSR